MKLIADEQVVFSSPDAENIYVYTPWLCHGLNGRIVASFDLGGPGTQKLEGPKSNSGDTPEGNQCRIMVSDNRGENWRETTRQPMLHARVFLAQETLYLLGHSGCLLISLSRDNGENWSVPVVLDDKFSWHQSGCSIDYRHQKVYLTMERKVPGRPFPGYEVVFMSARVDADLTKWENWQISSPFDMLKYDTMPNKLGMPFFREGWLMPDKQGDKRYSGDSGILESNVVRIYDENHYYYDSNDRSNLIIMRVNSNLSNWAAVMAGVEHPDGSLSLEILKTPQGGDLFYIPFPGGQMKFHIVYDENTKLYWTATTQTTDTFRKLERLPETRFNLPYNERNRLALYFSSNLFDWCFAGMIALRQGDKESRHYASLLIDGNDILVFSRSGTPNASCAHNGDLLTLHRVKDFARLVY